MNDAVGIPNDADNRARPEDVPGALDFIMRWLDFMLDALKEGSGGSTLILFDALDPDPTNCFVVQRLDHHASLYGMTPGDWWACGSGVQPSEDVVKRALEKAHG